MKRLVMLVLVSSALLLSAVLPSEARGRGGRAPGHRFHGHGRVLIGVGPSFWWGPYPYWWYYPPPYDLYPTPVLAEEPPVYIQQPTPPTPAASEMYWYYCASAKAYYPIVQTCPEPWIKVPARP